ncbi:hypothetical protein Riv7116_5130 [Rivularia sp. PCC 7116]|nr:hypothetical protein Riv7116_5130 [Rivularia sp. PCC 7116]
MKFNQFNIKASKSVLSIGVLLLCVLATSCDGGTSSKVSSSGGGSSRVPQSGGKPPIPDINDYIKECFNRGLDTIALDLCRAEQIRQHGQDKREWREKYGS